jgi:hypothetical protein
LFPKTDKSEVRIDNKIGYKRYLCINTCFFAAMLVPYPSNIEMFMQVFYSSLAEKDQRRYAAVESLKLGRGGVSYICKVLGISKGTVLQGRKELAGHPGIVPIPAYRQRREGGGRKKNG